MTRLTLETLGLKLVENRGDRGIREVAKEVGVSPATLSRVERGHLPDLETFGKICRWLKVNPGEILGIQAGSPERLTASAHFKKDSTLHPDTAKALAELIVKAHEALSMMDESEGSVELV